jgi:hypothetical protein
VRVVLLLFALGCSFCLRAAMPFPPLALYSLRGERSFLPNGKKGLVFMGCRREACTALAQWHDALLAKAGLTHRLNITVVPVFPSCMSNVLCRTPLMALIRRNLPDHLVGYVGVLFSNIDETASLFHQPNDDFTDLHVFLIDETGSIVWQTRGEPTTQSLRQLEQFS